MDHKILYLNVSPEEDHNFLLEDVLHFVIVKKKEIVNFSTDDERFVVK